MTLLTSVLLMFSAVSSPAATATAPGRYVPNQIIVKFRVPAADTLEQQLHLKNSFDELTVSPDLDLLNTRYGLKDIEPLCKNFRKSRQRRKALQAKTKSLLSEKESHILARLRRAPKRAYVPDLGRIYLIQLDLEPGQSLQEVIEAYESSPDVEYAELNCILSICTEPNDTFYPIQWPLHNTSQMYPESGKHNHPPGTTDADIDAPAAWDITIGASEVIVAVLDTGVDYTHRDLDDNMWVNTAEIPGNGLDDDNNNWVDDIYGYDFINGDPDPKDDNGHGTHCAGIIAAEGNNALDVAGVCWDARIMAIKFLGSDGTGGLANAIKAVYYAVQNGADVISNSWSGFTISHFKALEDAFEYAHSQGVVSVAAAGNDYSTELLLPAFFENVISVAATDSNDQKAIFSNYGSKVDIAAPGVDILSLRARDTSRGTTYTAYTTILSGTSMACPHVSGAFALLFSLYPAIDIDQAADIILQTTDHISGDVCASGRLNLYRAVQAVADFYAGKISFDSDIYSCSAIIELFLSDLSLAGNGTQDVNVVTSGGDLETVTLIEAGPSSGTFDGTISTDSGDPIIQDGTLQLAHRQFIVATYEDEDDGTGNPATAADSARADCRAPVVLNLQIDVPGPEPTVTFDTNEPTTASVLLALACGDPCIIERTDSRLATSHTIILTGVLPFTKYFFVIHAVDIAGNETIDDNAAWCYEFTTTGPCDMYVPAQYSNIQYAINKAWDGSTIWVADGIYTGEGNRDIDFIGKAITVRSENGPENCVIDCRATITEPHRAFQFYGAEDPNSILAGFKIINGYQYSGGAILCSSSSPTIADCDMTANTAVNGGAIFGDDSNFTIVNCVLTGNTATRGGAISCRKGAPKFINSTFTANFADSAGGAIFCWKTTETLTNSIFWNNLAPAAPQVNIAADPTYCCIQNWTGAAETNIDADPRFVAPGYWADVNYPDLPVEPSDPNAVWIPGDYRLLPHSPCIDAASDANVYTDIEGNPRPFDFPAVNNNADLPEFDIGAYEATAQTKASLRVLPRAINRRSRMKAVKALVCLPEAITKNQIDSQQPLVLFPGAIESISQFVLRSRPKRRPRVCIIALFNKDKLINAIPYDGRVELNIVGRLNSGQYFYGSSNVRIFDYRWKPWRRPRK